MHDDLVLVETLPSPIDCWAAFAFWSSDDVEAVEVQFHRILFFGLYQLRGCGGKCDVDSPPAIFPFVQSLVDHSLVPVFSTNNVEAANYKYLGVCDAKDRALWQAKAESAFKEASKKVESKSQTELQTH